jgi:peptide/nickel transport system ATP-binding protein
VGDQIKAVYTAGKKKVSKAQAREATLSMLEATGLPDPKRIYKTFPHELSGGMAQRILIAMALINSPELVIADDATNGLDVTVQRQVLDLMTDLIRQYHASTLMITHDLGIVARYCKWATIIYAGQTVEVTQVAQLLSNPLHPYTRALIGSIRSADVDTQGASLPGLAPDPMNLPTGCYLEPRCPARHPECKQTMPDIHQVEPGHWVRCVLYQNEGEQVILASDARPAEIAIPQTQVDDGGNGHHEVQPDSTPSAPAIHPQTHDESMLGRVEHPLLRVEDLVKHFPIPRSDDFVSAVSNVSFEIERGKTLGLVGESGSGKTTVGRCILKLIPPTSGTIWFGEDEIGGLTESEFRPFRRHMQMVFQEPYFSLNQRYTAFDTISEPIRLHDRGITKAVLRERVSQLADRVRLDERKLFDYPFEMSGGMQQRVAIARAIATNPDLIVLDEPISMLDLSVRGEIIDLLTALQEEFQIAYLFISHDLTTVEYICHQVAVMYLGQIVEFGTVEQVFKTSAHPYGRALLSSALPADQTVQRTSYLLEGEIPSPVNLPEGCYLASRCPEVTPECHQRPQVLQDIGDGHLVRCWRVAADDIPEWDSIQTVKLPSSTYVNG